MLGLDQAERGGGTREFAVALRHADPVGGGLHDRQEAVVERLVAGAAEVLGGRRIAAGEDRLGVLHAHLLHRVDEQPARLGHRGLGGAVHRHHQLVDFLRVAHAPRKPLAALEGFGQRNLDLRVAEETVRPAERRDRGVAASLQGGAHPGEGVALGQPVQLG